MTRWATARAVGGYVLAIRMVEMVVAMLFRVETGVRNRGSLSLM